MWEQMKAPIVPVVIFGAFELWHPRNFINRYTCTHSAYMCILMHRSIDILRHACQCVPIHTDMYPHIPFSPYMCYLHAALLVNIFTNSMIIFLTFFVLIHTVIYALCKMYSILALDESWLSTSHPSSRPRRRPASTCSGYCGAVCSRLSCGAPRACRKISAMRYTHE
jgi:hypothetical protein